MSNRRLPNNWRDRLPDPVTYYSARITKLTRSNAKGWAQGSCPLHEDRHASLSVNLTEGRWRCFAGCGAGDLLGFHMQLTGLPFKEAVRDLIGGGR